MTFIDTASATVFDEFVGAGMAYEMPQPIFQGAINGIWTGTGGSAYISERIG